MSDLGRLMFRIISLSLAIGLVTSRPVKAGPMVSYSTSGTFDVNSTTGSTIELNKGNFTIELFYTGTTQTKLPSERLLLLYQAQSRWPLLPPKRLLRPPPQI